MSLGFYNLNGRSCSSSKDLGPDLYYTMDDFSNFKDLKAYLCYAMDDFCNAMDLRAGVRGLGGAPTHRQGRRGRRLAEIKLLLKRHNADCFEMPGVGYGLHRELACSFSVSAPLFTSYFRFDTCITSGSALAPKFEFEERVHTLRVEQWIHAVKQVSKALFFIKLNSVLKILVSFAEVICSRSLSKSIFITFLT